MMGEWKPRPKPEAYVDALFGEDLLVRMAWVDKESPNPEEESKGKSKGGPSAFARGRFLTTRRSEGFLRLASVLSLTSLWPVMFRLR